MTQAMLVDNLYMGIGEKNHDYNQIPFKIAIKDTYINGIVYHKKLRSSNISGYKEVVVF